MNKHIVIAIAPHGERRDILQFYKSVNEHIRLGKNERVFTAKEGNQIIGAIRLVDEGNYCVLRTLYILPEKQRQGIGKALVKRLLQQLPKAIPLYCLPYPYVKRLYANFGFRQISPEKLPRKIKVRYQKYIKAFEVIAMEKL